MMGERELIRKAMGEFPKVFGLRAFPGRTFYIEEGASYVSGNTIYLYLYRKNEGDAFCKATPSELRGAIVR